MNHTIIHQLADWARLQPERPLFTMLHPYELVGTSYTFHEVWQRTTQMAMHLKGSTAHAAVLLPQGIEFTTALLGCMYAGVVAVPLAVPTRPEGWQRLHQLLQHTATGLVICQETTRQKMENWAKTANEKMPAILLLEEMANLAPTNVALSFPHPQQLALLQCTSGSVSLPKAVMITHANIMANSAIIAETFATHKDTVSVCWLPTYHHMGLIDGVMQPIYNGFHSVHLSPLHFLARPAHWLQAISRYGAHYSGGPNFAFDFCSERILDADLEGVNLQQLQCLYNGAEPIRMQSLQRFVQRFSSFGFSSQQLLTCYGLAEGTLAVSTSKIGHAPNVCHLPTMKVYTLAECPEVTKLNDWLVSCGSTKQDTRVLVMQKNGKPCVPGETGEICIVGNSITPGYYHQPTADNAAFFNFEGHGYFRTGDLGFIWQNELYINGRMKDLIIIRGKNIYPQDVETIAANADLGLNRNAAAAFSEDIDGEEKLVLVQEVKRTAVSSINYEAAARHIRQALSQQLGIVAARILLVPPRSVPITTSGKIQRSKCKILYQNNQLSTLYYEKN